MAREIIHAGLANEEFIRRATTGYASCGRTSRATPSTTGERITGVPAEAIASRARVRARRPRGDLLDAWASPSTTTRWTTCSRSSPRALVRARGKYGSGVKPAGGRTTCRARRHGGDPNRLPASKTSATRRCARVSGRVAGPAAQVRLRHDDDAMFDAMRTGTFKSLFVIGENPVQSEADHHHAKRCCRGSTTRGAGHFLTATRALADVVLPSAASWCEADGTVVNLERRVQLCRKAARAARQRARRALDPHRDRAADGARLGAARGRGGVERGARVGAGDVRRDELRAARGELRPAVALPRRVAPGHQVPARAALGGPGRGSARAALGRAPRGAGGDAGRGTRSCSPPGGGWTRTTRACRRRLHHPMRKGETLDLSPEDAERLRLADGDMVRVSSRRGTLVGAGPRGLRAPPRRGVHDLPFPGRREA